LDAVYGLHRLSPALAEKTATSQALQALNPDRSVPDRTAAMIRWTLNPFITYTDVVDFLERHTRPDPDNPKDKKGLAVNIIEACLKGVMYNDEVPFCVLSALNC
jgi:hypothetical protein